MRSTLATSFQYAAQNSANLPALSPTTAAAQSNLTVTGLANQTIVNVKVLVTIAYTVDSQLKLTLISPSGTKIVLAQGRGGNGSNYTATVFDDQSLRSIAAGTAPFTGNFRPTGSLETLVGTAPDGTWKLQIDGLGVANGGTAGIGKLLSWGLQLETATANGTAAQTGDLMDQDGNGVGGENPGINAIGSVFSGLAPADVYADPLPTPPAPAIYNFNNTAAGLFNVVPGPYDPTTLPLQVGGPHIVSSFILLPNNVVSSTNNLVTDQTVSSLDVVFDRDMNPASVTLPNQVLRLSTPYGTYTQGQALPDGGTLNMVITADPNSNPTDPGSDPDLNHPRTYRINFEEVPAGGGAAVAYPLSLSGTYSVTLASDIEDEEGNALDTNQNAGLDILRGTPSAGTLPVSYFSTAAVPFTASTVAGETISSPINVPAAFTVQRVTVALDINYHNDPDLTAFLVAPSGTEVQLFANVGAVGNRMNFTGTVLDDTAQTDIINGGPPFNGTFTVDGPLPLSTFIGTAAQGVWQLVVTSDATETGANAAADEIKDWSLTLSQPLSNSGLGEPQADVATQSFRIYTQSPTDALAANTFSAVGPDGEGAKAAGGNAEVSGRVNAIAVDPSDPSGNTVYVGAASGGLWKTTDFLTSSAAGPTWVPLVNNVGTYGIDIASIAISPVNNDPNQSIIYAATGDGASLGDPARTGTVGQNLTSRSVGVLKSTDGGASWTVLNDGGAFSSQPGQAGVTSYKIVVDPNYSDVVYLALSDIDGNGNAVANGPRGGLWKSTTGGLGWTQTLAGEATDVSLDLNSANPPAVFQNGVQITPPGTLQFVYAAIRGVGVYFSPNNAQNFDLMLGQTGDPLIQDVDPAQPEPIYVHDLDANTPPTPNGNFGQIVLARPSLTDSPLSNLIYQGWMYAAVVEQGGVQDGGGHFIGLYMTKDFGQNWVKVRDFAEGTTPSNSPTSNGGAALGDYPITGSGTPLGNPFALGNYDLALSVDPNNPNIVYLGGTDEFQGSGLVRIDTTDIHDAHAFYTDSNASGGATYRTQAGTAVEHRRPHRPARRRRAARRLRPGQQPLHQPDPRPGRPVRQRRHHPDPQRRVAGPLRLRQRRPADQVDHLRPGAPARPVLDRRERPLERPGQRRASDRLLRRPAHRPDPADLRHRLGRVHGRGRLGHRHADRLDRRQHVPGQPGRRPAHHQRVAQRQPPDRPGIPGRRAAEPGRRRGRDDRHRLRLRHHAGLGPGAVGPRHLQRRHRGLRRPEL